MTDHGHRVRIRREIFFRQKGAPKYRLDAHHVEIIGADQFAPDDLRTFILAGTTAFAETDTCRSLPPCAEVGEASVLRAQIHVIRIRKLAPSLRILFTAP